jgi:hypothetical protein
MVGFYVTTETGFLCVENVVRIVLLLVKTT